MAAWTELERAKIRHYLGFSAIFLQADPRLENAMTTVLAIADGGTRADSSTQTQIQGWITDLETVETNLKNLWNKSLALKVDVIQIDPVRGMMMLRAEGRRIVTNIATALATKPRRDVFSASQTNPYGDSFEDIATGYGGSHSP